MTDSDNPLPAPSALETLDLCSRSIVKRESLACILQALLTLNPTGEDGFEGMLQNLLTGLCKIPFRLAKSGAQQGQDGQSYSRDISVSFEAKLYTSKVPKAQLLSKVTEIIARDSPPDIWVLGSTVPLAPQDRNPMKAAFSKMGVAFLCLDWSESSELPFLAALCAEQSDDFLEFPAIEGLPEEQLSALSNAIGDIKADDRYAGVVAHIKSELEAGSIGLGIAQNCNKDWLNLQAGSREKAKAAFGQALAPFDEHALPLQSRTSLVSWLTNNIYDTYSANVLFVTGEEGHGKSWSFVQSWQNAETPALTIIIPANDMTSLKISTPIDQLIIQYICAQTSEELTDLQRNRWRRRFEVWENLPAAEAPRLVIYVDGINQRPALNWGRWIEKLALFCAGTGAKLVVSTRQQYFKTQIKPGLTCPFNTKNIPEWTEQELNQILEVKGITRKDVANNVARSLRNPRLLGIALSLLDKSEIATITELNPSRLLFSYMFESFRDGASEVSPVSFQGTLSKHAKEILGRIDQGQTDDLAVFEVESQDKIKSDFESVSSEQFFMPIPGGEAAYELKDEGLDLALGIAICNLLRKARRNEHDLISALENLLDPVAALDKTADILLSALVTACLDNDNELSEIQSVIMHAYLSLQNIDSDVYPVFSGLVRKAPKAGAEALFLMHKLNPNSANNEWLVGALREIDPASEEWKPVANAIKHWLSLYTRDAHISVISRKSDADYPKKIAEREALLEERFSEIQGKEAAYLKANCTEISDVSLSSLSLDIFYLLSDRALEPFAEQLVTWSYCTSLNSGYRAPDKSFIHLIRHNKVDWSKTRTALLKACEILALKTASETAKWAYLRILRAISSETEAIKAEKIYDELTSDRQSYGAWRLIEKYCDTDPCDPESAYPSNYESTKTRVQNLKFEEMGVGRGMTSEDHYFQTIQSSLARFEPDLGWEVLSEYADIVLTRDDLSLKLCLFALEKTPEIFIQDQVESLIQKALVLCEFTKDENDEAWITRQIALSLALPYLDAKQQAKVIKQLPDDEPMLIRLEENYKPLSQNDAEDFLEYAITTDEPSKIATALVFIRESNIPLSQRGKDHLRTLIRDSSGFMKGYVLALLHDGLDDEELKNFAKSDWSSKALDEREDYYETWYGSCALIVAAKNGFISESAAFERIRPSLYDYGLAELCDEFATLVAKRLHASLQKALKLDEEFVAPLIETTQKSKSNHSPTYKSLVTLDQNVTIEKYFETWNESDEDFKDRQKTAWASFAEFEDNLTELGAGIFLENFKYSSMKRLYAIAPDLIGEWAEYLVNATEAQMKGLSNLAWAVGSLVSDQSPEITVKIFEKAYDSSRYVNFNTGRSKLSTNYTNLWSAHRSGELERYWFSCLDHVTSDQELADHALAAHLSGRIEVLKAYIQSRLQHEIPAYVANAITLAGFCNHDPEFEKIFEAYKTKPGFIGEVTKKAIYAYERNIWARHWYKLLCAAKTNKEYWRYGVLFSKVVDARFDIWIHDYKLGEPVKLFSSGLDKRAEKRIQKWSKAREGKLFGLDKPNPIFTLH